jgi:hypothetical protein
MTVLMTVGRRYELRGHRCRIEWQRLAAEDVVTAHLDAGREADVVFPDEVIPGLRPQPYWPHAWLLDRSLLGAGWRRLDLVVQAHAPHGVSLAVEVHPADPDATRQVFQHPGVAPVPGAPMLALRIAPDDGGWTVVPHDEVYVQPGAGDGRDGGPAMAVPDRLREPAALARREGVVHWGEPVTALVDLSASMRPCLVAGTLGIVLQAVQAVAGAAGQSGVSVLAVSDRVHGPRILAVSDDAEDFLRRWVRDIGLRTGRGTAHREGVGRASSGLVVSVSDRLSAAVSAPSAHVRSHRVVLAPPGEPAGAGGGAVVISEPRPSVVSVVRALGHASPAT